MSVNLDMVKEVLETQKPVKIYHDFDRPTIYKPIPNGVLVKLADYNGKRGKTIAIFDESLKPKFLRAHSTLVSENPELLERISSKKVESEFGTFKLELYLEQEPPRLKVYWWCDLCQWRDSTSTDPTLEDFVNIVRTTKSYLLSAYVISKSYVSYKVPVVIEPDPLTLLKLAIITAITGYYDYKLADVKKIEETPVEKIVKTLKPLVRIPFPSGVPIIVNLGKAEFYSADNIYVFIEKDKHGKPFIADFNACVDYDEFRERVRREFEKIVKEVGEVGVSENEIAY